ncbi:gamma-glutamyltransferase [Dactylosporangium sp. AC04546]|uniref:gamma-glutamyltransferase n=1 Tax=Dactylosporangium sp. AC04546 TaxID=2862460 RepID=UPI001EDCC2A7|nr:gamma-glutamyltransferase [Dactylosporangium sp. AC04546]WVK83247.1 gamma-glutamyltransferase [Dactylosporangium sp. AC04546]
MAATLASCVAESVLTGLAGGGFATYYEAATGTTTCLDFFCAVPGLDAGRAAAPMVPISIAFGGVPQRYEIGASSVGVPGVPAGMATLHRRWGRLPWQRVVTPAASLARSGTLLPHPHASTLASIAPAMLPGLGAAVYAPGGKLLEGGELLHHPGLDVALGILAEEGPAAFYTGRVGRLMADVVQAGGGVLTAADLAAYRVLSVPVVSAPLAGASVQARADLNDFVATVAALPADLSSPGARTVALANALRAAGSQRIGDTTNISVVDPAGNACVVTVTLGIGSGVWLPDLGVHLNSMLGEGDLVLPGVGPGERMASCMCPTVVTSPDGLVMGIGSAGATRIRTALLQTLVNVLVDGDDMRTAIRRPRFHVVADVVHLEAGFPAVASDALVAAGFTVQHWDRLDHYFGGVSAVGLAGAAGDPRRGGIGLLL